jgi:RNA polymerase sigma factor (sigma-70 family)
LNDLASLLAAADDDVLRIARHQGRRLLRHESADDLAQGIRARALERGASFEFRSEAEFRGWLQTVAQSYLADRHTYWTRLKRNPARLVRLTWGAGTGDTGAAPEPPGTRTGPSTFASRREQLALAVRALSMLLPRDRDIVTCDADGLDIAEIAERLSVSYDAAERARLRALERFRKAYRLLVSRVR